MTALVAAAIAAAGAACVGYLMGRRFVVGSIRQLAGRVGGDEESAADGGPRTLAAVERTLTASRSNVERLHLELTQLRRSLDELPFGVVVAGQDGHSLLRNRAADTLLGQRHTDVLVVRAVDDHLRTAMAGDHRREVVDVFGPPKRSVVVRSTPVLPEDASAGAGTVGLVTVEDVSDRVRLEAMRTDFVANISHELRTPVGAIALLAETLQGERDPETIDRLAGKLEREARRVSNMIDDLLQLSRIEVEGARRDRVPVDAIIGEAVARVQAAAEQRGIGIERVRSGNGSMIAGDRQQLVSALSNLADNAVKYSESGGRVTVSEARDGDEIVLVVADDGMGIPDRDLDRVFERFYRVDRARSRATGGTGLGLAIVRHVADNHGGSITVSSREGVGSTFTLRLPAWDHSGRSTVVRAGVDQAATSGAGADLEATS